MRKRVFKFSQLFSALSALALLSSCFFSRPVTVEPQFTHQSELSSYRNTYPDAEYILYSDVERISVNADGTSVAVDEMVYLILTESGRRGLRSIPLAFNPFYETLIITEFAVERSGQKTSIPLEGNSSISIDSRQMTSNIFDPNQKILRLNIPDLQVGDRLWLTVQTNTHKLRIPGVFTDFIVLQSDAPVLNYRVEIDTPATLPLASTAVKGPDKNLVKETFYQTAGRNYYTWDARGLPQLFLEPNMPDFYSNATRVLVSTAPDWATISKWYFELCQKPLAAVTPEMVDFVESLKKRLNNNPDLLKSELFKFVSQDVRYMGTTPEEEAPGYEPHPVSMTFKNRAGVCRDKAALLVVLFNLAGFEAYPVLFMAGSPKDQEVPNSYFNHAIVGIKGATDYELFDPTFENTKDFLPGYEAEMSYLVAAPGGETLRRSPAVNADLNRTQITQNLFLDASGTFSGTVDLTFSGSDDTAYRDGLARMNRERQTAWISGLLQRVVPGAILTTFASHPIDLRDVSQPLRLTFSWIAPEFLSLNGKAQALDAPDFGKKFGNMAFLPGAEYLEARVFPMQADTTASQGETICWKFAPEIQIFERPEGNYILDGNTIKVNAEWIDNCFKSNSKWVKTRIEPEEYAQHRKDLVDWTQQKLRTFIVGLEEKKGQEDEALRIKASPEADIEIVDLKISTRFNPETKVFHKDVSNELKIVNYNGLKNASELKIHYTEPFDTVTFVSGEVESPDGSVIKVSPDEIKIMDSPQNNVAPGHAPQRILVVNFPSVQVGSIIRYSIKQTEKNRSEYSLRIPLISSDSVHTKKLSITSRDLNGEEKTETFNNLELLGIEPGRAPLDSWAKFFESRLIISDYFRGRQERLHVTAAPDASIKALAKKLQDPSSSQSVKNLRDYAAINLRQAGPASANTRVSEITPASEVLKRGYGNAFDFVSFYKSILDLWGVDYQILLVMSRDFAPEAAFAPSRIDSVLIRTGNGEYLGLESQYSDIYGSSFGGYTAYDLASGQMSELPYQGKEVSRVKLVINPELSANIALELKFFSQSSESVRRNREETPPEILHRQMQQDAFHANPSARNIIYHSNEIPNGFETSLAYDFDFSVSSSKQFLSIDNIWSLDALPAFFPSRKTPVLAENFFAEWTLQAEIPENLKIVTVPSDIDFNKHGVILIRKTTIDGSRITVFSSLKTNRQLWSAAEAEELGSLKAKLLGKKNSILLKINNR